MTSNVDQLVIDVVESIQLNQCKSHVNLVVCGLFYFYGILYCNFN